MPGEWNYIKRVVLDDNRIEQYSISFCRQASDEWYDEVRYDSHDRRRGQKLLAPHFHMKLASNFKRDSNAAVEEIREIINNYLGQIKEVLDR